MTDLPTKKKEIYKKVKLGRKAYNYPGFSIICKRNKFHLKVL